MPFFTSPARNVPAMSYGAGSVKVIDFSGSVGIWHEAQPSAWNCSAPRAAAMRQSSGRSLLTVGGGSVAWNATSAEMSPSVTASGTPLSAKSWLPVQRTPKRSTASMP